MVLFIPLLVHRRLTVFEHARFVDSWDVGRRGRVEEVENIGSFESCLFMIAQGMRCWRWSRSSRWGIDDGNRVVTLARIFDVGVMRSKRLQVVVLVLLLLLSFGFLLLVELALVLLVFGYAGLHNVGQYDVA
jgi:hypothetical protein